MIVPRDRNGNLHTPESLLMEFAGYLSAAIPELHTVEAPRLIDATKAYLATLTVARGEEQRT